MNKYYFWIVPFVFKGVQRIYENKKSVFVNDKIKSCAIGQKRNFCVFLSVCMLSMICQKGRVKHPVVFDI